MVGSKEFLPPDARRARSKLRRDKRSDMSCSRIAIIKDHRVDHRGTMENRGPTHLGRWTCIEQGLYRGEELLCCSRIQSVALWPRLRVRVRILIGTPAMIQK